MSIVGKADEFDAWISAWDYDVAITGTWLQDLDMTDSLTF